MIKVAKITEQDRKVFAEIEYVRMSIIRADLELKYFDYGAGDPEDCRTEEEMLNGIEVVSSTSRVCAIGLKSEWAEYMYSLIKAYKPKKVLELGTCCGFSSIYMSKASPKSEIHTLDGAEAVSEIAGQNMQVLGCENITRHVGRFADILDDVLSQLKSIDFIFIDGHHDKDATINYFNKVKDFCSSGGIIVFDGISWSKSMREAWEIIISDDSIAYSKDKTKLGVVVMK